MRAFSLHRQDSTGGNFPPPPSSPPPPPSMSSGSMNDMRSTIPGMASDMKLVGIFSIICGIIECLSCIGVIIGIPLIIAGVRLRESAEAFLHFSSTNNSSDLDIAIQRQSRYFFIQKIFIIICFIFAILYIIGLIIAISTGVLQNLSRYNNL